MCEKKTIKFVKPTKQLNFSFNCLGQNLLGNFSFVQNLLGNDRVMKHENEGGR